MVGGKKVYGFDGYDGEALFEGREVEIEKPPVYLLSRLGELKVATFVSELGLLSTLEENGIFSKLESAGAFSTAEKLLPTIESLGLLSKFEESLEVEAGLIFTAANFALAFPFILLLLTGFGFAPAPSGVGVPLEITFCLAVAAVGAVLFAQAYAVSLLQGD